jgi:hypothetical protein
MLPNISSRTPKMKNMKEGFRLNQRLESIEDASKSYMERPLHKGVLTSKGDTNLNKLSRHFDS